MPARSSLLASDQIHMRLFVACRTLIDAARWTLRNMQDSFWRLYLNAQPGAQLELLQEDGTVERIYDLAANQLLFVPAGVRFHTYTSSQIDHFYIHFDLLGIPQAALQALFSAPIAIPAVPYLLQEAHTLAATSSEQEQLSLVRQCRIKALVYAALAAYLEDLPSTSAERYQQLLQAQAPIQPALHAIETRLGERLNNRLLAELCHLSEDYFIRVFHASVGQSPLQYIQAQRVRRAAQLLLFSMESIEQIAMATGFGTRAYFSRVFARHLGVGPAAYRRIARV
jgi:AraC family transcriptional activator of mtrCDE